MQAPICKGPFRIERPVEIGDHRDAEAALAGNRLQTSDACRIALDIPGSQAKQRQVARLDRRPFEIFRTGRAQSPGETSVSRQQIKSGLQAVDAVDE